MPSIVVYVPFCSPAIAPFQESQMSHRGKNIPSDTFKFRQAHTQSFIKTGIHLSDHTQSSSVFSCSHNAQTATLSFHSPSNHSEIIYNTTLWLSTGKIFFYSPQHCTGRLPTRWGNSYFAVEGQLDSHERFSVSGVHCLNGLYIVTTFRGIWFL